MSAVTVKRIDLGESSFALCHAEESSDGELVIRYDDAERDEWFGPARRFPRETWIKADVDHGTAVDHFINQPIT